MKYSIIVPVYNVENYLRQCLDSIVSQTFTDFEIILINDGSTDNSGHICDEYVAKDGRVKVFHKKNGGQSSARNVGIKNALGEYIIFLDSDDFICSTEFFAELNRADQTDVIIYKYSKYYSADKVQHINVSYVDLPHEKNLFLYELVKRDGFYCSCWTKAIKRSVIFSDNIFFDENLNCEDIDWYYRIVLKAQSFTAVDKCFIMYRQRQGSVTQTTSAKTFEGLIYTFDKWEHIFNNLEDDDLKKTMLSSLAKIYCNALIACARSNKTSKNYKKDIYSYKGLLTNNLNPRTAAFSKLYRILGIHGLVFMLKLAGGLK